MTQATLNLEPRTLARRSDPITSQQAAARVGDFAGTHYAKILEAMTRHGEPMGAEQIAAYTSIDAYQVRKRLPELQRMGRIEPLELYRATTTRRMERLWRMR